MANFRKSFNFRNGVQVDSSNFIVNPNGLVGIGTSIPSEALDLKGNAKVSGLTTTNTFAVGSGATFYGNIDIGDVSINSSSGIVSATSFRGDGSLLDGVVAIATDGLILNLSGLHTFKSVGIGTSNQSYYLQIEGDPTTTTGVGITNGIVRASGGFVGDLTGDVTGNVTGDVTGTATTATNLSDAANITTGTISSDRLPTTLTATIIGTATTATNLSDAANITTGTISNDRLPATINSDITGTATTATNLADAANITTGIISNDRLPATINSDITGTATTATNLANAANITTGTINPDRLPATLTVNITGTATTATNLFDGANITTGTISDARLPATITSNITGNAGTATTLTDAANITTGTISDARLPDTITSNINVNSGVSTFIKVVSSEFEGDLVGSATTLSDAANITTGTISDARLPDTITSNINVTSGVSTFLKVVSSEFEGDLVGSATTLTDAANITTGTISDARLPNLISSNINVTSGVSTFLKVVSSEFEGDLVGDVTGTATTATNLTDAANITTGTISDARLPDTITSNIDINTGTSVFNQIGINTDNPNSNLHIRGDGSQIIQVTSDSNSSKVAIGRTVSLLGYNGFIEYGNSTNGHGKSFALDFVNYGPDGINYYLQGSAPTTSNFTWHRGLIADELMTLTPSGNLGIGITNPEHKLDVQGISTFSGSAHFNQNVTIDGNLNFNPSATITLSQVTSNLQGDVLSSGSDVILDSGTDGTDALLTGNIFVPSNSGISTFREIHLDPDNSRPPLRVSTASTTVGDDIVVDVNSDDYNKFVINDVGGIGIGTTTPVGALDLRYAARTGLGIPSASFVNFPEVTTPQRGSITAVVGSVIYNSTSNRLEILLPGGWAGISTEA